jgi:hypothetical protein
MLRITPLRQGLFALLSVGASAATSTAQVGDISSVTYPGWLPSDRVYPAHTVIATYDQTAVRWTYDFTLANGSGAPQAVLKVKLRFDAPVVSTTVPINWQALVVSPTARMAGVIFRGVLPEDVGSSPNGPALDQIAAGQSRTGFRIVSAYPPGYARSYTQGFAAVPYLPSDWESTDETGGGVPADSTNSQRRFILGPSGTRRWSPGGTDGPESTGSWAS